MPSYQGVAGEEEVIRLVAYLKSGKVMAGTTAPGPATARETQELIAKAKSAGETAR